MSQRNGALIGAVQVFDGDEVILISDQGTLVRTRSSEVSVLGRNTQGVTLIKVQDGEKLVQVARVAETMPEAIDGDEGAEASVLGEDPAPSSSENVSAQTSTTDTPEKE